MVKRLILLFILFIHVMNSYSQEDDFVSDAISDCDGAMNIIEPGVFRNQHAK